MANEIRFIVIRRLFAIWAILSLIIGGIVYAYKIKEMDQDILDLAVEEASIIDTSLILAANAGKHGSRQKLQSLLDTLTQKHFDLIEVYDQQLNHIAVNEKSNQNDLQEELSKTVHKFPLGQDAHYEFFNFEGQKYLQILLPRFKNGGEPAAYVEGVFHVSEQTEDTIWQGIYRVMLLIVAVIAVTTAALYPIIMQMNARLFRFSKNLVRANIDLMEVLGDAVAARDTTTNTHNFRVTLYAVRLAEHLNHSPRQMTALICGAFLHDVGKIGTEDAVLLKNGRLDKQEREHMRTHVDVGIRILKKSRWLRAARDVVAYHHERYDGSGYPHGLKQGEIPINARIFAIADVFDALCSQRPYKEAIDLHEVMSMMEQEKGKHFDPKLLDLFLELAPSAFRDINNCAPKVLEKKFRKIVDKYFFLQGVLVREESLD